MYKDDRTLREIEQDELEDITLMFDTTLKELKDLIPTTHYEGLKNSFERLLSKARNPKIIPEPPKDIDCFLNGESKDNLLMNCPVCKGEEGLVENCYECAGQGCIPKGAK